jgi:hypothetical protein
LLCLRFVSKCFIRQRKVLKRKCVTAKSRIFLIKILPAFHITLKIWCINRVRNQLNELIIVVQYLWVISAGTNSKKWISLPVSNTPTHLMNQILCSFSIMGVLITTKMAAERQRTVSTQKTELCKKLKLILIFFQLPLNYGNAKLFFLSIISVQHLQL